MIFNKFQFKKVLLLIIHPSIIFVIFYYYSKHRYMVKIVESSFNCNLLYGFMRLKSIQPEGYTSVSCATIAPIKCTVFLFSHASTYLANKKKTSSKTIKLRDIIFFLIETILWPVRVNRTQLFILSYICCFR